MDADSNKDNINSLIIPSKLWLSGRTGSDKRLPTVHIPTALARFYNLDKPCKITFRGVPNKGGILIKFFGELE